MVNASLSMPKWVSEHKCGFFFTSYGSWKGLLAKWTWVYGVRTWHLVCNVHTCAANTHPNIYKNWILFSLPMTGTAYLFAILASSIYMICCICLGIEKGWFQVPCDMNLAFLPLHADSMRKWNGHLTMYSLYKVVRRILTNWGTPITIDNKVVNPIINHISCQWEFQDPKMEVRKRTIFLAIFCGDIPWNLGQWSWCFFQNNWHL